MILNPVLVLDNKGSQPTFYKKNPFLSLISNLKNSTYSEIIDTTSISPRKEHISPPYSAFELMIPKLMVPKSFIQNFDTKLSEFYFRTLTMKFAGVTLHY